MRRPFGCVINKQDIHRDQALRGYVAMLVVDKAYRGKGVGRWLGFDTVPSYQCLCPLARVWLAHQEAGNV